VLCFLTFVADLSFYFISASFSEYALWLLMSFKGSIMGHVVFRAVLLDFYSPYEYRARIIACGYVFALLGGGTGITLSSFVNWRVAHLSSSLFSFIMFIWSFALEPTMLHSDDCREITPSHFLQLATTKLKECRTCIFVLFVNYCDAVFLALTSFGIKYVQNVFDVGMDTAVFYAMGPYLIGIVFGNIVFNYFLDKKKQRYASAVENSLARGELFRLAFALLCFAAGGICIFMIVNYLFVYSLNEFFVVFGILAFLNFGAPLSHTVIWSVPYDLSDLMQALTGVVESIEGAIMSVFLGFLLTSGMPYREAYAILGASCVISTACLCYLRFTIGDNFGYEEHRKLTEMTQKSHKSSDYMHGSFM